LKTWRAAWRVTSSCSKPSGLAVKITVCIATYRRQKHLAALLEDLVHQELVPDEVIVVDRDAGASAQAVIEARRSQGCPWPIVYKVQPGSEVSRIRYRVVRVAQGEWLAFIDDNERAPPAWLRKCLDAALHSQVESTTPAAAGPETAAAPSERAGNPGGGLFETMIRSNAKPQPRSEDRPCKAEPLQPGKELIIARDQAHPRCELLRRLRTELLLRTPERNGSKFFALLSPCAREGRSQLAAELAISFAQMGRKTLLVDADLRRPRQHELFDARNESGLAQALATDAAPSLHPVQGLPQLAVLTSGGQPGNPVELLHRPRFQRMVTDWQRGFDFVVLDTPPLSEFSDGLTIAVAASNVVVLGRAKATTFNALREMRRHLEPVQARIVGTVINDF
jgi:receptor protein-tyrosine kinase